MTDEWPYIPMHEWVAQGIELFGRDVNTWRFMCPSCGHIQTRGDWLALGMSPRMVDQHAGYSCIGRWLRNPDTVEVFEPSQGAGCHYVGGWNPNISPTVVVISDEPKEHRPTFGWAPKHEPKN